jgi:hypothetical protein
MYYFVNIFGEIESREYLYNAEALDGTLTSVDIESNCLLLVHVPTAKFTYRVSIQKEITPGQGLQELKFLNTQQTTPPTAFYRLILASELETYLEDKGYDFIEIASKKELEKKTLTNINPPKKSEFIENPNNHKSPLYPGQNSSSSIKLVRDSENSIYTL